jgi:hypothetical protein
MHCPDFAIVVHMEDEADPQCNPMKEETEEE